MNDADPLIPELERTLQRTRRVLWESWRDGAFRGELSSSALSTAVAAQALSLELRRSGDREDLARVERARQWIAAHQNDDGGYGDTTDSPSNVSTSTLVWAALGMPEVVDEGVRGVLPACERYLREQYGELEPRRISETIAARYGVDRTFSVPILTACALAGRFGEGPAAWGPIPALPFELAALPHACFAWIGLPTVSYALPALVAMGQVHHHHRPTWFLPWRALRAMLRRRTLSNIRVMQPGTGGFLEAAPLTGFVSMCLLSCGEAEHPIVREGLRFLRENQREDGSWPIDTNLDTWTTTLAINALHEASDELASSPSDEADDHARNEERRRASARWLMDQQHLEDHPFTRAAPGGWSWTDLSGGVPDADDTPGAVLALHHLRASLPASLSEQARSHAVRGCTWLRDLQNRDGGIPTFCRGWGKLPFDRSSPDLTAHTLRAWLALRDEGPWSPTQIDAAIDRAARFLVRTQRDDGAWVPLWFGNQHTAEQESPLYGTTRVLRALVALPAERRTVSGVDGAVQRAVDWILAARNEDGGWGGDRGAKSTIEESAWAVESLACLVGAGPDDSPGDRSTGPDHAHPEAVLEALRRGASWLAAHTREGRELPASPVGLYFAKLWYHERLYPAIFVVAALSRARRALLGRLGTR